MTEEGTEFHKYVINRSRVLRISDCSGLLDI